MPQHPQAFPKNGLVAGFLDTGYQTYTILSGLHICCVCV